MSEESIHCKIILHSKLTKPCTFFWLWNDYIAQSCGETLLTYYSKWKKKKNPVKNSEAVRLWASSIGDPQCRYAFSSSYHCPSQPLGTDPCKTIPAPIPFWLAHPSATLSIPLKITPIDKALLFSAISAILAHSDDAHKWTAWLVEQKQW